MRQSIFTYLLLFFTTGCAHRNDVMVYVLTDLFTHTVSQAKKTPPSRKAVATVKEVEVAQALRADKSHPQLASYDLGTSIPWADISLICNDQPARLVAVELKPLSNIGEANKATIYLYQKPGMELRVHPSSSAFTLSNEQSFPGWFTDQSFWAGICGIPIDKIHIRTLNDK